MTEDQAIAAGWFRLRRGWYHVNAWEPHGPYEPVCYADVSDIPETDSEGQGEAREAEVGG